jgi:acetylglutamate kinase
MKICLIKISGKAISYFGDQPGLKEMFNSLYNRYDGIVVVHGAGKEITAWSERFGIKSKFINGQRVTTKEEMKIVAAVQSGVINTELCSKINAAGIYASGFSGVDRNTFIVNEFVSDLGLVGRPELNDKIEWIKDLMKDRVVPVFSSICRDREGNLVNVNADIFAEYLALKLEVDTVIFLSDIKGISLNNKIADEIFVKDIYTGISSGEITDGMIPKLLSCASLVEKGIKNIWIGMEMNSINFNNNSGSKSDGTWIRNDRHNEKLKKTA